MATIVERASAQISVKGRLVTVPSFTVDGQRLVVSGNWLKMATFRDEEWLENEAAREPEVIVAGLSQLSDRPDIFSFAEPLGLTEPRHPYHFEVDNVAAVRTNDYAKWWDSLPQASRKNVRRAQRRGVVVSIAPFDDALVNGVTRIYNETPIRQGRKFWHYGKDAAAVKAANATYLERSIFIAAHFQDQLIGFIKMVDVDGLARIMQILSMNEHFDKRPGNALIAKAIEVCCQRNKTHFIYGKFVYGNKENCLVTDYKRRNGFERIDFRRYYVPLTLKGRIAVALRLYRGLQKLLPEPIVEAALAARARYYGIKNPEKQAAEKSEKGESE